MRFGAPADSGLVQAAHGPPSIEHSAVVPDSMATHPYDLAAWVVAAEAGVVVESLDGSPLRVPLDTSSPVSWAAYANEEIAVELRARIAAVGLP